MFTIDKRYKVVSKCLWVKVCMCICVMCRLYLWAIFDTMCTCMATRDCTTWSLVSVQRLSLQVYFEQRALCGSFSCPASPVGQVCLSRRCDFRWLAPPRLSKQQDEGNSGRGATAASCVCSSAHHSHISCLNDIFASWCGTTSTKEPFELNIVFMWK